MGDCLFCKIIKGDIPSEKIYEDENTFAFLDIAPNNHGHTLVIPKKHYKNIYDIPSEVLCDTMKTAHRLAPAIKEAVNADGVNIAMNNESAAGQVIFHAHVHIIPRLRDDGYKHFPKISYKNGEAAIVAEKIRIQLK